MHAKIGRREFLKTAGGGIAAATAVGVQGGVAGAQSSPQEPLLELTRQGPKEVVEGRRAVAASQSPIVTNTMLEVLEQGGNAADAFIAGSITQATVQLDMTNHTGTVSFLYWHAKSKQCYYLNSMGVLHPALPPLRTYPPGLGGVATGPPMACLPGFMPGMQAIHERFGSQPWAKLVEPAIPWAEDGFPIDEFTRAVLEFELRGNTYYPAMRELFTPNGITPSVGEKLRNPELARTLRRLATDPEDFTKGEWARQFVEAAHSVGWNIQLSDLSAYPARWTDPVRYGHRGYEIVQPAPPERQGVYCALVLGMLRHLEIEKLGHYSESAESLYYFAQAMRRAAFETGHLHDPEFFHTPLDVWMSDEFHASLAGVLERSLPKEGVDLTRHVELTSPQSQRAAFGWASADSPHEKKEPAGSCELVCVDAEGNWAQAMNTLQSGGIPGLVVGGVPMVGSHAGFSMAASIAGWLGLPGARMRSVMSNTIILENGHPVLSLGSPGNVHCTVPQMISNNLDYDYTPYEAAVLPRMLPMRDDYTIDIEARVDDGVVRSLAALGAKLGPLPPYDFHMGSYQQAWRDRSGRLGASVDPRRAGIAGGLP